VRAIIAQATGKYYWEVAMTTWADGSTAIGVTNLTSTPSVWSAAGLAGLCNNGVVYLSGNPLISGLGALTSGALVCFALDAAARLLWVRIGAAGNWNASATYNPATGVGGGSISSITGALCPVAEFNIASETASANFGDSAFSGTVPSGFIAGFSPSTASAQARVLVMA
jgi:hypothetical protein